MSDPVEQYLDDSIADMSTVVFDAVTLDGVSAEVLGARLPVREALFMVGEDTVKESFRDEYTTQVEAAASQQKQVLLDCADYMENGGGQDAQYDAYQDAFIDGLAHWVDHLNPEAAEPLYDEIREAFDDLVEQTTYYRALPGETFSERVVNSGDSRHESEERLKGLTGYIDRVAALLDECDEVYVEQDRFLLPDIRFYVQDEGVRVVNEVRGYRDQQVKELLDTIYS